MRRPLAGSPRAVAFSLVELLVVMAIVSILIAMLLPSLRSAREAARRVACASNLRQLHLGLEMYADDFEEFYPLNDDGRLLHMMLNRPWFRTNYLQDDNRIFFCPSGTYRFDSADPTSWEARRQKFMGYWYLGGLGNYTRDDGTLRHPTGWAHRASENGKLIIPTVRRVEGARHGNADRRPLVLDAAGEGQAYKRQERNSSPAFPANNHAARFVTVPDFENIVFVDGHLEAIGEPTQYPVRFAHPSSGNLHYR